MRDYEDLFVKNLHQKLKDAIVGKVYCKVRNNELYVKIESYGNLTYEVTFENFSDKFINGLTTEYAAYQVIQAYKNFVVKRYFK